MSIDFVLVPAVEPRSPLVAVSPSCFFDPATTRRHLAFASASGFGAVIVDDASGPLANLDIAASVARWNRSLDVIVTHWAGVASPTVTAADIAALDRQTGGRLALRMLVEAADIPADLPGHAAAWQRTDEYLTLLKRLWSNDRPIDHEGPYYRLHGATVADRGPRGIGLPIRLSGQSGTAVEVAARHASVFELPSGSFADAVALIDRVRAAAGRCGRSGRIRFAANVRVSDEWFAWGVATLWRLIAAGVSQFLVSGLHDAAVVERFETEVIRPLARVQQRRPRPFPSDSAAPDARLV
ncbi:MAG: LLM class flavin-dependent oxidoreductase [Rhizobiaceae bacterium]|nr:LLM class flavin-dependent oxidoreductase [Rhizobiaceae bacterium]